MSPHGPEVTPEFLRQIDLTISIARNYTNAVAYNWGTPDLEIGTAITMRAGNHLFALTARHCARPDTRLFLTFGPRQGQPVPITRISCHPDPADDRDVAILEIENSDDGYGLDKRQATTGGRRVPERTLHLLAFLGGWPGALLGQRHFRHKTEKVRFLIVFWVVVVLHLSIAGAVAYVVVGSQ